jgi:hypothetical protein
MQARTAQLHGYEVRRRQTARVWLGFRSRPSEDWQEDIINIADLETAAYEFTADYGTAGEMHERGGVWQKVKDGIYSMFSIEGTATREEV